MAYHRLVGVEHFFVYDNESKVPVEVSLAREIREGVVTVRRIQGKKVQMGAYKDCLATYGTQNKWIAFIDTDEFLLGTSVDDIREILHSYEEFGGLAVNWVNFGSSGRATRPTELQMEAFTASADENNARNSYVKWIAQPRCIEAFMDPHTVRFPKGVHGVDENKKALTGPFSGRHSSRVIRVNHYHLRSKEEWAEKALRGGAMQGPNFRPKNWFEDQDSQFNVKRDTTILRFAPRVRKALGKAELS